MSSIFSLPDPLHPAVVHLPIALAVLMPAVALGAAIAIWRGWLPGRSWVAVLLLQATLAGSGWLALETGEQQEERVERVVAERPIETHEERAEQFQAAVVVALAIIAAGLLPGAAGSLVRGVAVLATLAVLGAGIRVGHSGGELVYRHGAADAYTSRTLAGAPSSAPRSQGHESDHDDD